MAVGITYLLQSSSTWVEGDADGGGGGGGISPTVLASLQREHSKKRKYSKQQHLKQHSKQRSKQRSKQQHSKQRSKTYVVVKVEDTVLLDTRTMTMSGDSSSNAAINEDENNISSNKAGNLIPKCTTCGQVFRNVKTLTRHQLFHDSHRAFGCDFCGKRFGKKYILKQHKVHHCPGRPRPYSCSYCEKTFDEKKYLEVHEAIHVQQPERFQCEKCKNKLAPRDHVKNFSFSSQGNVCRKCNVLYGVSSTSKRSKVRRGDDVKPPLSSSGSGSGRRLCHICSLMLGSEKELRVHMKKHDYDVALAALRASKTLAKTS